MQILVLNGPNLNLLGTRRPDIYGSATLGELEASCQQWANELGVGATTLQSNHEGDLIDALHGAIGSHDAVIVNPGALSHYSYALHDAIEAIPMPVVEVHISDILSREEWRRHSVVSAACTATITGKGLEGYREAMEMLVEG